MLGRDLPVGWEKALPSWEPDKKGVATRKASGEVLKALADVLPELWGGSADLAESNNTTMEGANSFGPKSIATKMWDAEPYGRTLHFGVREHAMGAILNGIALHGPTRPYGGTFLTFSDYMRGAVRLAAVMKSPVIYVWTHDSIGLGEDGPTHQPIEHLAALRAIPNLSIVRPGDANETAYAWKAMLENPEAPKGICLTRQNIPVLEGTSAEGVARGGYVLADASNGDPQLVLIGTGSELQIAVDAREVLEGDGIPTRVVSMPCMDWFAAQDQDVPRLGAAADGQGPRLGRGRDRHALVPLGRRRRRDRLHRALRCERRLPDPVPRVRVHHRARRDRRPHQPRPRLPRDRVTDSVSIRRQSPSRYR